MNKLGIVLGAVLLAIALTTAPIPLTETFTNPPQRVIIYPNLLIDVPLILLAALLLLYGLSSKSQQGR